MKRQRRSPGQAQAFTLVELMVAGTVAAVALLAVLSGSMACQRVYSATDGGFKATADQLRVLDYIGRDVRQALTVTVTNSGQMLTLTVPDYVDPSTGLPRVPTLKPGKDSTGMPNGTVDYGTAATVIYFPSNGPAPYTFQANGQYIIRQQGAVQTVISRDCLTLQLAFVDQTTSVSVSVTYAPKFILQTLASSRASTTVCMTPSLRNSRRN